jgi:hypothetical protein
MRQLSHLRRLFLCLTAITLCNPVNAQEDDFPASDKVLEGFAKVESKSPDGQTLGNLYTRDKDSQAFIELPKDFASQKYFIALTVSSGDEYAGLQAGDYFVYWRQYDKRLALILPNVETRSTGEPESKASVKRLFTDRVLADVPIVTMIPRGGPLIDADELFVRSAVTFFGQQYRSTNSNLTKIVKAKAFSKNIEIAFETVGQNGVLQTLHYSFSEVPEEGSYRPRTSDERIGFFTTSYSDLGKYKDDEVRTRYINRWRLEKRDPKLKISPPVQPIRFYVEHTTPVRYRRWVKQGVEYWNKAFEKVGFADAIEVYYQDASTGAYMDLDPEDVQYNFIRWLNNNNGTAIGPSRVHPLTGEILDADIILTDGWIRYFDMQFEKLMPEVATEGMSSETLTWLANHPTWDPRVLFAKAADRKHMSSIIQAAANLPMGGHPMTRVDGTLIGDNPFDGLVGRTSQVNGLCLAARGKQMQTAFGRMAFELLSTEELANAADDEPKDEDGDKEEEAKDGEKKDGEAKAEDAKEETKDEEVKSEDADKKEVAKDEAKADGDKPAESEDAAKKDEKKEPEEDMLDGMPESFIGPLLAELVAHEVGHTIGLRHNFKASGVHSYQQINSDELKSKKPLAGSVMDYLPINIPCGVGTVRGDYTMIDIGPYDFWAIEYGYTPDDSKLDSILDRCAEPELQYATDEDTGGPDPFARRYDYTSNPLEYATNQMVKVKKFRERLLDRFVKDGDSWAKAREGYELTLSMQMQSVSMMANWVGGAYVRRDRKGDPGDRRPIEPVPAQVQKDALKFVIENTFRDDAFGLSPEILERLTIDKWWDDQSSIQNDSTFPVHDSVLNMQASALTMLMNPTTLRRVFDNEQLVKADQEALVLPDMMDTLLNEIWSELDQKPEGEVTARKPRISSLRRNLQREHLERLIDLAIPEESSAITKPIATLAVMQLRELSRKIDNALQSREGFDAYSQAHLFEALTRINKALDGQYIYNMPKGFGMGGFPLIILGEEGQIKSSDYDKAFPAEVPQR